MPRVELTAITWHCAVCNCFHGCVRHAWGVTDLGLRLTSGSSSSSSRVMNWICYCSAVKVVLGSILLHVFSKNIPQNLLSANWAVIIWVLFSCSPHHRGHYRIKAYPTFLVSLVALSLFSKRWNISKWTLSSSIPSSSPISWSWSLLIAVCKSSSPWLSAAGSDKLQFSVRLRRSCRRWN